MKINLLLKLGCFAAAAATTHLFFIQYCHLLFACGCQALWAGASATCNIHAPAPPHCPWCLHDGTWGYASLWVIVGSQAVLALWPGRLGAVRGVAVFLAFPVVGGVSALVAGLATGYWG